MSSSATPPVNSADAVVLYVETIERVSDYETTSQQEKLRVPLRYRFVNELAIPLLTGGAMATAVVLVPLGTVAAAIMAGFGVGMGTSLFLACVATRCKCCARRCMIERTIEDQ